MPLLQMAKQIAFDVKAKSRIGVTKHSTNQRSRLAWHFYVHPPPPSPTPPFPLPIQCLGKYW